MVYSLFNVMDFKLFQKPQRYIGNEWNVVKKDHSNKVTICLGYPDLYEVGMSNLGLRIIYGALNQFNDVVCERVFMPAPDLARFLRKRNKKLFSLETKTPLDQFAVLGFNFNYVLNFINFLHILNLGGLPVKASQRRDIIVLGGGIDNPQPLAEFVDVFFLGEFEGTVPNFVNVLRKYKDKESRLKALSQIEGVYVPKFYTSVFENNSYKLIKDYKYAKLPIKRVYVRDLNTSFYPVKWLTPHTQIIHDRIPVEIARGCPNQCTFCQARAFYWPYRQRSISTIEETVKESYRHSGYENFSFLSLSASDYSSIEDLIDRTSAFFQERKIGLSLPSLRADDILGRLYTKLAKIKKTSLTIAVEAANESLRRDLNKKIDINKLFEAVKVVRTLRLKHIKTYFMFGFPQETGDDLAAIGVLLRKLHSQSGLSLNASINTFIPKPFSLWEGEPMQTEAVLLQKKNVILRNVRFNRNLRIFLSNPKKSILEAVICRADRKFWSVIYRAFTKDTEFSTYDDASFLKLWYNAIEEEAIDYRFYLEAKTDNFPWSFIETGQKL
ncbi:MAG: radical SAM protein [Candidatus Omnitrophota bacterium]|nr:MAG: radical SAM protein [Candidatus Omnitrophota bacterium]